MKKIKEFIIAFLCVCMLFGETMSVYADESVEKRIKYQADQIAQEFQGRKYEGIFEIENKENISVRLIEKSNDVFEFQVENDNEKIIVTYPCTIKNDKINIGIEYAEAASYIISEETQYIILWVIIVIMFVIFVIICIYGKMFVFN